MMMSQSLVLAHRQALSVGGGATASIFPKAGKMLNRKKTQRLLFTDLEIDADGYKSMMDCLFVETFPEYKEACQAYYAGKGPQLREVITSKEIKAYDLVLCGLIELAHALSLVYTGVTWAAVQVTLYDGIATRPTIA
jgi:hypothetical protein